MNKYSGQYKNPDNALLLKRNTDLYATNENDVRSEYYRDYTRILHSNAYRRLKHKTQVFYNINNDHICTRIEHVNHVDSVSYSIAKGLGLDTELTKAIACGHDLGHAPFGHQGETVIDERIKKELSKEYLASVGIDKDKLSKDYYMVDGKVDEERRKESIAEAKNKIFWHERNGVRLVDKIELLPDAMGVQRNLSLTYAVRDGIISHCGEVDQKAIKPREEYIDLKDFTKPGQFSPFTWEGCVVKVSDKIAYLGRDIEDAIALGFLNDQALKDLKKFSVNVFKKETLNTTGLMHTLIGDIIENSSPEDGIMLSHEKVELLDKVKAFNYEYIYHNHLFDTYKDYVIFIINRLYDILLEAYDGVNTITSLDNKYSRVYPKMTKLFRSWLKKYCDKAVAEKDNHQDDDTVYDNEKVYGDLTNRDDYVWAVTDFIAGMTDSFAITMFNELISFGE